MRIVSIAAIFLLACRGAGTTSGPGTGGAGDTATASGEPETATSAAAGECDPWAHDCPAGQKCTWWSDDGEPRWNAVRCVPAVQSAGPLGPCTVEDGAFSGEDDCALGYMCVDVDRETGIGF